MELTDENMSKTMKGMEKSMQETRQKAYDKIIAEVMETDIRSSSAIIIDWALAKHFNIETDIFETKEKWI